MDLKRPHLSQIAFSVIDIKRSVTFYREVFGLIDAGGTRAFRGPAAEQVQGLEGIASTTHWLIDGRSEFQLEFFEFEAPPKRSLPPDWRPCDIGYTRLAFEVRDLDAVLARAGAFGAVHCGEVRVIEGRRYAALRDVDGVLVEVAEDASRLAAGCSSRVVGVAASVPDLSVPLRMFEEVAGPVSRKNALLEKDALWGLEGADRDAVVVETEGVWMELSTYRNPVPVARDARSKLVDIGLSHVAFGIGDFDQFFEVFQKAKACGLRPNSPQPATWGRRAAVMYMNDEQGFTYELFFGHPKLYGSIGFAPPSRFQRLMQHVSSWVAVLRYGAAKQTGR